MSKLAISVIDAGTTLKVAYDEDSYQFGFRAGHAVILCCTYAWKSTINHYVIVVSHVFVCFIDLEKAFDKVNYLRMFIKLLYDGIKTKLV